MSNVLQAQTNMSNSTAWVSSDTKDNLSFLQTILNIAFSAAGLAGAAFGIYNYAQIVRAITHVARGHARDEDQRILEEGLRHVGEPAFRAVEAYADGIARLNHTGEAQRVQEVLRRARQPYPVNT